MDRGYAHPLYILPFDHRGSFRKRMFGWEEPLDGEQRAQIAEAKRVIYEGFETALAEGVPAERAGILVDEEFGSEVIRAALARGRIVAVPAERSGSEEFQFEYGERFAEHIEAMNPTFCKVLVRYNPEGDAELNRRQTKRLATLSRYLERTQRRFMFELLVPPTPVQLEAVAGDRGRYDRDLRPSLMVRAIEEIQDAGVEPDVWKIEGVERREDCERVAAVARRDGRDAVGCIVLGRGENEAKVREWLAVAAGVPGYIGFAVGRTTFWEPIRKWREGGVSRTEAAHEIARRYRGWVEIFEQAR